MLNCKHQTRMVTLEFQVVDKLGKNLLGLPDSLRLGIVHLGPEVYEVNTSIAPELEVYKNLVDHTSIGKLLITCKLEVDTSVNPVVRAAHCIPIAMKPRVKAELDKMESQGIISKVEEPTEWVSPMVAAKKKGKDEIRLYIDPRDLNKALKRPHHLLKTLDDILKEVLQAKVFTVLDAKQGFWKLPWMRALQSELHLLLKMDEFN